MSRPLMQNRQISASRLKPDWRTSKMGYKFDRNDDVWQVDGSTTINLGRMRDVDEITSEGLRKALCRYAEELSAAHLDKVFGYFNAYCDYTGERDVSINGLTAWRTSLTDDTEWKLGALKGFLIAWNEWGFPGVGVCQASCRLSIAFMLLFLALDFSPVS